MATEENNSDIPHNDWEQFRDFEAEPPPQVWQAIRARLGDGLPGLGWRFTPDHLAAWIRPRYRLYPALTALGLALIALFIWMSVWPAHQIRGTACVNQDALARGTAYLFRVHDRHVPFDSVLFYGKTELDSSGRFEFRNIPTGSYLLRIQVHPESPYYPAHHHAYYRDQLHWNRATLIRTDQLKDSYPVSVPEITEK
ncbi:MAG: hypothetical protein D4R67_03490 [Bacteroidetes bacterium]|nr:MAG: hypothetical protein D4R67_03490 [Bacteroidota bacterium]